MSMGNNIASHGPAGRAREPNNGSNCVQNQTLSMLTEKLISDFGDFYD